RWRGGRLPRGHDRRRDGFGPARGLVHAPPPAFPDIGRFRCFPPNRAKAVPSTQEIRAPTGTGRSVVRVSQLPPDDDAGGSRRAVPMLDPAASTSSLTACAARDACSAAARASSATASTASSGWIRSCLPALGAVARLPSAPPMPSSARVISTGITHTLLESPAAICGSACRYW